MGNHIRLAVKCLTFVSILVPFAASAKPSAKRETASELQREARLNHAHELLGKYYSKSVVKSGEKVARINRTIYRWVREHLPEQHRKDYKRVAQAIIDQSMKYNMDPVFLMSVIQGESSFDPERLGTLDEIGLMQLRPSTAQWICEKFGMKYKGAQSLFDPVTTITIGAAYLNYLRDKFDSHAQLYLAAYNMGARNVGQALDKNVWPKDYPAHVMKFYVEFYSSLDMPETGNHRS